MRTATNANPNETRLVRTVRPTLPGTAGFSGWGPRVPGL